ncbi:MAG: hypothetical protein HRU09_19715 [Oligoflexales bacterium]|nr:hypothetical protein [Oligoflexales bacterium]
MVSHDLAEASYLEQNLVLLKNGLIEQQSSFKELYTNPQTDYVRYFVGSQRKLYL